MLLPPIHNISQPGLDLHRVPWSSPVTSITGISISILHVDIDVAVPDELDGCDEVLSFVIVSRCPESDILKG